MSRQQRNSSDSFGSISILDFQTKRWVPIVPNKIGDLKHSIYNSDHSNWMKCDGRSLLRSQYPALFSIIGTSFGSSSSTTFNIPNSAGRVLASIGQAEIDSTNWSNGNKSGSETHTMDLSQMPSHNHSGTTVMAGSHIILVQ